MLFFEITTQVPLTRGEQTFLTKQLLGSESKSLQTSSKWNNSIDKFCSSSHVKVVFTEIVSDHYCPNVIELVMTEELDGTSKAACFFRHVTNAFVQGRVLKAYPSGDLQAYDEDTDKKMTMRLMCSMDFLLQLANRLASTSTGQSTVLKNDISLDDTPIHKIYEREEEVKLYHYTKGNVLPLMAEAFMNNKKHDEHPAISVKLSCISEFKSRATEDEKMFDSLTKQYGKATQNNGMPWNYRIKLGEPFIFCLSEHEDSKPLWEKYADKSQGIVIGFRYFEMIKHLMKRYNTSGSVMTFEQCHYITKNQAMCRIYQYESHLALMQREDHPFLQDWKQFELNDILRCKSTEFVSERETRMILFPSNQAQDVFVDIPITFIASITLGENISQEDGDFVTRFVNKVSNELDYHIVVRNRKPL